MSPRTQVQPARPQPPPRLVYRPPIDQPALLVQSLLQPLPLPPRATLAQSTPATYRATSGLPALRLPRCSLSGHPPFLFHHSFSYDHDLLYTFPFSAERVLAAPAPLSYLTLGYPSLSMSSPSAFPCTLWRMGNPDPSESLRQRQSRSFRPPQLDGLHARINNLACHAYQIEARLRR